MGRRHCHETLSLFNRPPEPGKLIKPQTDKLDYKFITLENSLQALLISDPETDKAAAAMDVYAGTAQDPQDVPGLAHFTEHMLFYSSEKYPNEDEYSKFISDHGGLTNAYTATENTNYHFDVNWNHLEPALDRFAQFFICPLISEDGVDREVKAVDSEHKKNLNTDGWRMSRLSQHTSNQAHPCCKFGTGDIGTLSTVPRATGRNPRDLVVEFHSTHYSANLMRLVVLGRQSVTELEALVTTAFSAVPNKELPQPQLPDGLFLPEHLCKLIKAVPQTEGHSLDLMWPVPTRRPLDRNTHLRYLKHIVHHEGKGSLFALLKEEGWASSLSSGESGPALTSQTFFSVTIELTDSGHEHVPEILGLVHRHLDIIREEGIREDLFNELKAMRELGFRFRDKQDPYSYVSSLSEYMQHYRPEELLLVYSGVAMEFDEARTRAALAEMIPQNLRVFWASKKFEGEVSEVEPIYGTKYSFGPIPEEWLAVCKSPPTDPRLHMPEPNPFIPTDLQMLPAEGAMLTPQVAAQLPLVRVRHQQEGRFPSPKAAILLEIQSPIAYLNIENSLMNRLMVDLLYDYLNEVAYAALLAGLSYSFTNTTMGMEVSVTGYHDKLGVLLDTLLTAFLDFKVKEDRLELAREQLARQYSNMKFYQPYEWAMHRGSAIVGDSRWTAEEAAQVVPDITAAALQQFRQQFTSRCFVEGLVVGNLPKEAAVKLANDLQEKLTSSCRSKPPFPGELNEVRAVQLPEGATSRLSEPGPNPDNDNSAALLVHQVGPDDVTRTALAELLVQLGRRDAFHQLRTVEQLGYMVFFFKTRERMITTIQFLLQSAAYTADHLASRVEAFLLMFKDKLEGLKPEDVDAAVAELAAIKLQKPKRLAHVTNRLWSEILNGTLMYNRQELEVAALRSLTLEQVVQFADEVLLGKGTRRQLAVHIAGHPKPAEEATAPATAAEQPEPAPAAASDITVAPPAAASDITATPATTADTTTAITPPATATNLPQGKETQAQGSDSVGTLEGSETAAKAATHGPMSAPAEAASQHAAPAPGSAGVATAAAVAAVATGVEPSTTSLPSDVDGSSSVLAAGDSANEATAAPAAAAVVVEEGRVIEITDEWEFKRRCNLYPLPFAQEAAKL